MRRFNYTAKDTQSVTRTGLIEAPDEKTAAATLRQHGLIPIEIRGQVEKITGLRAPTFGGGVSHSELVNFTRQVSTMIDAGLTLSEALALLEKQIENKKMQKIVSEVLKLVEGGSSLANALSSFPKVFSQIYVSLVQAGEQAGVLDEILSRLADNLEKEREFRSKTRGALIYPAIIVVAMIGVVFIMLIFVIPRLTDLYKEFGTSLPLPTRMLITLSDLARKFWFLVLGGFFGFGFFWRNWTRAGKGRKFKDALLMRIPIWGKLKKNASLSDFARTLSLLVGAGIPIIDALQAVGRAIDNVIYEEALDEAAKQVEKGFPLGQSLEAQPIFPPIIAQMVKTGEETGKLDEVLARVAHYFETESEQGVKNLTTAIEPIILIILAFGVAFLIISVILPIYNLTSQF